MRESSLVLIAFTKSSFSISSDLSIIGTKTKNPAFGMGELAYGSLLLYDCPTSLISVVLSFGVFNIKLSLTLQVPAVLLKYEAGNDDTQH